MDKKICVICEEEFTEFGNNARPVAAGRCCDRCNEDVVVPARIGAILGDNKKEPPRLN